MISLCLFENITKERVKVGSCQEESVITNVASCFESVVRNKVSGPFSRHLKLDGVNQME
jgi:hypothetical protein